MYNFDVCKCSMGASKYPASYYMERLHEEWGELIECPSIDELSDCSLLLSLFIYRKLSNRVYICLPFANKSLEKGRKRLAAHGCVRSERNKCS